jgi:hypothetical protein
LHARGVPLTHRAFIVGTPPAFRGGISKGRNLEEDLLKYFPNVAYFIEKVSESERE